MYVGVVPLGVVRGLIIIVALLAAVGCRRETPGHAELKVGPITDPCDGVTCTAQDECHTAGVCNPNTGTCSNPVATDGTPCSDGSACTLGDVCNAGVCQGPTTVTCAAPDACHAAGACNPGDLPATPPSQDLIGWWHLEGDGTDSSGGGHNLTKEGGVAAAPGRFGTGMKFDGTSCMSVPVWDEARMQGAAGFTLMMWVNPSDAYSCPQANPSAIMAKGWDYGAAGWCQSGGPTTPGVTGEAHVIGAQSVGFGGPVGAIPRNQWTLVTITWDHSSISYYLNGHLISARPEAGALADATQLLTLGCLSTNGSNRFMHFVGTIDEAMLYRRALGPAEIGAYYTDADPCTHTPLTGNACNDGNACTQTDTCDAGTCAGTNPVTCAGPDQCHPAGTCNPSTGVCSNPTAPDGTPCDDASACTQGDVCNGGVCQGLATVTCSAPDVCHTAGTCEPNDPRPQPPSEDLVGWWHLEGDGADASGGAHDLTNEGATLAPGRFGKGMKFDGASCMSTPVWDDARIQGAAGLTLMMWVNPSDLYTCPQANPSVIMGKGWDYGAAGWCQDGGPTTPGVTGESYVIGDPNLGFGGPVGAIPRNQWTLVTLTWDHSQLLYYLDGRLISARPEAGDLADVAPVLTLGCLSTNGSDRFMHFAGTIDEAMLYRRALTAAEIGAYYTDADPCAHAPLTGNSCSDGNACTQTDTCQAGTCVGANPIACVAQDMCHQVGTCEPSTGACSTPPIPGGFACNGSVPINYHLSRDGHVSIAIYDASGIMVRELVRAAPQSAGDHTMVWDGLDRKGNAVPAGSYSWKLLSTPGGLAVKYVAKVGDNYPGGTDRASSGGVGSHVAAFAVAVDATGTYIAAHTSENRESIMVKIDPNGIRAWSQLLPKFVPLTNGTPNLALAKEIGFDGARSLAIDNGEIYMLGHTEDAEKPPYRFQQIFVSRASDGAALRSFDVHWDELVGHDHGGRNDTLQHGATDIAVHAGILAVAYRNEHVVRWYRTSDGQWLDTADIPDPRGVAFASDGTLFVTSGTSIVSLGASHTPYPSVQTIQNGLTDPGRLTVDESYLWVYEASTRQVVRFPRTGGSGTLFGFPGGRQEGPYVGGDFGEVTDLEADGLGGFWIAEPYGAPRRVAHIAPDGTLAKEWHGGQPWNPHAEFDPDDPAVMVVSSGWSSDLRTRYFMRVDVDYGTGLSTVRSTFKFASPDNNLMADSAVEGSFFHVYKRPETGRKYLVTEGSPSIRMIDESATGWRLLPVTGFGSAVAGGIYQWNDANGNWKDDAGERNPMLVGVMGAFPQPHATFDVSHLAESFDHYFVTRDIGEPCRVGVRRVVDWNPEGAPRYDNEARPSAPYACPERFSAVVHNDPRWSALLHYDVASKGLYAAFNAEMYDWGQAADSFVQHWNASGTPDWAVGELSPVSFDPYRTQIYRANEAGTIHGALRGIAGVAHGCVVVTDVDGGWTTERAQTYVWDQDGLFVGGIMDNPDLNGIGEFMYQCSGELAHSTLRELPNGDVYFAANFENNVRIYKVTGWDDWVRLSGSISINNASTNDVGQGLAATYFDNLNFTDARTVRVDPDVDFAWGAAAPTAELTSPDSFAVRWVGAVRPAYGPKYSGVWWREPGAGMFEGGYHKGAQDGSRVEFKFNGTRIRVVGFKSEAGGTAYVYLDDDPIPVATADESSAPGTTELDVTLWEHTSLPPGDHTVTVKSSNVFSEKKFIYIDRFDVNDIPVDDDGLPCKFYVESDDGAELWVGKKLALYDWGPKSEPSEAVSATIKLLRDKTRIQLSCYKGAGGTATARLKWESSPFVAKQIIPSSALFSVSDLPITEEVTEAVFAGTDLVHHGNWKGSFGVEGAYPNGTATPLIPRYATITQGDGGRGFFSWSVGVNPLPPNVERYPVDVVGSGHLREYWVCERSGCASPDGVAWNLTFTDQKWHKFTLYSVDDEGGVPQLFEVRDLMGNLLSSYSTKDPVTGALTDYQNGIYVSWYIRGSVSIKVSALVAAVGGRRYPNVMGYFVDPAVGYPEHGMKVTGNGQSIPDGINTPDVVNGTAFGSAAGATHVDHTFTISNGGALPLRLTGTPAVTIGGAQAGDFLVVAQPPSQIAPGASAAVTIRFQPVAVGPRKARILIANDTDQSLFDFAVQGTGAP